VYRLCGLASRREIAALNDAIIYPHAITVLTRDMRDFDAMNQIPPDGRVLFYDRDDETPGDLPNRTATR
jgi:hypothetical protein